MTDGAKRRYIVISSAGLPPLTCRPEEVLAYLPEFIGRDVLADLITEPMDPVTLTETWLTDAQYEALSDWSP